MGNVRKNMKRWKISTPDSEAVEVICKRTELSQLCAEIMTSRGVTQIDDLAEFFNSSELSDPFELKDMDKAVEAINNTLEGFGLICVYGDYDCDGVTATVVLYNYLECIGANVMYYIPEREEGYGLNRKAIDEIASMGAELIVTVDNGVSAINEAEYIYEKGMKLVITDHHQLPEVLPRAEAIVDPHRKDCSSRFKDTAGVGVALKLCAALDDGNYDTVMEQYADIAAIGTVADIVPLKGENRIIVSRGIDYIKNTENYGINYLMEQCSLKPEKTDSTAIAFMLAPRINAAGRFGSPIFAVKALLEEGEDAEAEVEKLVSLNNQRKEAENRILEEILSYLQRNPSELLRRVLVIAGKGWHHGVIGIVSARLLEMFGKPNIIISYDDSGQARGSARSVKGFHIHKCLTYCGDLLDKFGGHECAGGMSLPAGNIGAFKKAVLEYAKEACPVMPEITLYADKVLRGRDLTIDAVRSMSVMEPFGEGNPKPVFAVIGARINRIFSLSGGKHTKLEFEYDGTNFPALLFFTEAEKFPYKTGELVDCLVTMDINEYNGRESVSVKISDIRLHGVKQEPFFAAKSCYERFMTGESLPDNFIKKIIPQREELVWLYKIIAGYKNIRTDILFMRTGDKINYCKLRLCVDILCEAGLVEYDPVKDEASILKVNERKDLSDSKLFVRLRNISDNI